MPSEPATPSSDFPDVLALPGPFTKAVPPARWLLAGLLLSCLAPRAIEAWKIDTLCKDGVFYVQLAEGFERGDLEAGLGRLRLNVYPLILSLLHRLGLDWELAAESWGVIISSLAVLPLFGWIRRQFDDRVAIAACFLYAVHPKFLEWSPEAIRDPTFWFFWNCSLYATWRAVSEVRLAWFAAAGVAATLALHTRFEGWFLYLPLVWWSACRYWSLAQGRRRVVGGALLAFAVCPALLLLANVSLLRNSPRWELGNFSRLEYVALWYQSVVKNYAGSQPPVSAPAPESPAAAAPLLSPTPAQGAATPLASPVERADVTMPRMPTGKTAIVFLNALRRGIGGLFAISWLVGFVCWRRIWLRRDQLVLFVMSFCIGSAIWIHLWYAQATSSRYFLTIDVLASACAALGWLKLCEWASWAVERLGRSSVPARAVLAAGVILTVGVGCGEALTNRYTGRQRDAALGRWLKEHNGANPRLAASGSMELVEHYASAVACLLPADRAAAMKLIADWQPNFIVASKRDTPAALLEPLMADAGPPGFERVEEARLPPGFDWGDVVVLEHRNDRRRELELASQVVPSP